eukprot:CAMPEP_0180768142 /NCGR_PEP_ID=MMETSP1038_2-20121128/40405_1 /TAXON_ID=632150 /ORGANISM="Azadinium spinosum, Strain 3D9" /LENGTH=203 /DNA_ID=CAMNT_0022802769 /DNA_START=8 /DNA_END=619 /DNA_ORIENTATION=+
MNTLSRSPHQMSGVQASLFDTRGNTETTLAMQLWGWQPRWQPEPQSCHQRFHLRRKQLRRPRPAHCVGAATRLLRGCPPRAVGVRGPRAPGGCAINADAIVSRSSLAASFAACRAICRAAFCAAAAAAAAAATSSSAASRCAARCAFRCSAAMRLSSAANSSAATANAFVAAADKQREAGAGPRGLSARGLLACNCETSARKS